MIEKVKFAQKIIANASTQIVKQNFAMEEVERYPTSTGSRKKLTAIMKQFQERIATCFLHAGAFLPSMNRYELEFDSYLTVFVVLFQPTLLTTYRRTKVVNMPSLI